MRVRSKPHRTKQDLYDDLRRELGLSPGRLGPGAKEHKVVLHAAAARMGLKPARSDTKQGLGRMVVESVGHTWSARCQSKGQTVTARGLEAVLHAVRSAPARRGDARRGRRSPPAMGGIGTGYRHHDGGRSTHPRATLVRIDLDSLDRATREHQALLRRIVAVLTRRGVDPLGPGSADPKFDLAWRAGDTLVVVEAKSTQDANRDQQERLGIGQVLEYQHLLRSRHPGPVVAVLATSTAPRPETIGLCGAVGIVVTWPDALEERIRGLL